MGTEGETLTTQKVKLTVDSATPDGRYFRRGGVRFMPSVRIADSADDVLIEQAPAYVRFGDPFPGGGEWGTEWGAPGSGPWGSAGAAPTVDLFPCNLVGPQSDGSPAWHYTVYYDARCPGSIQPWSFVLLSTNGTTQRLSQQTELT